MGNQKALHFEERQKIAKEKVSKILLDLNVDILAVVNLTPTAIEAKLIYFDKQDIVMLRRLGIEHLYVKPPIIEEKPSSNPPQEEPDEKLLN